MLPTSMTNTEKAQALVHALRAGSLGRPLADPISSALEAWRTGQTIEDFLAARGALGDATGGALTINPWGRHGLSIDLARPAKGLTATAAAKVYLNEPGARLETAERWELAAVIARAVAHFANA